MSKKEDTIMRKMIAFIMVVLIAMAQAILPAFSFGESVDRTASTTASATKPEDVDTGGSVLDNFNDNGVKNLWNGATGAFPGAGGTCGISNTISSPWEGAFCLKADYNVDTVGSYAGYYSLFGSGSPPSKNISGYKRLVFYVKGAAGGEFFKIEMKNNAADVNNNAAFVYANDFLETQLAPYITTSWKQVVIPLHNFSNISDWTNAREFVATFEENASRTNVSPTQGTIYLDRISFDTTTPATVYIDRFSDRVDRCMLGGIMGPMGYASRSYVSTSGTYNTAAYGLLLEYNMPPGQWGGAYFIFGGGSPGNSAVAHNFNDYAKLRFWAKAMGPAQNPVKVKIELLDDGGQHIYWVTNMSTTPQDFVIDLSSFPDLQKTSIKQLNFVFSYWDIPGVDGVHNATGGIYIDDIRFTTT